MRGGLHPRRVAVLGGCLLAGLVVGGERPKTALKIGPGPTKILEEERSIVPDPAKGIEHGVILLEEFEVIGLRGRYTYHLRAKILSPEAASLGDIEIPHNVVDGILYTWWGRTILPDGKVLELDRKELEEQTVLDEKYGRTVKHLRGALPGIVPGCVIDYGYQYGGGLDRNFGERVALGRAWPIRTLRFRWVPEAGATGAYHRKNTDGLQVQVSNDGTALLVTAADLPTFREEPFMPPLAEVQPSITFYYLDRRRNPRSFWTEEAKEIDLRVVEFFKGEEEALRKALNGMGPPAGADLTTKLKVAYDWVLDNILNLGLRYSEEIEAEARERAAKGDKKEPPPIKTALDVLKGRKGYGLDIDWLFLAFARLLGAEAHVVAAPDRTRRYWDTGLADARQLPYRMVAVWSPGESIDKATVLSPGDGIEWGDLPWWTTGATALIATPDAALTKVVPVASAEKNLSESEGEIEFSEANDEILVRWSRRARRQQWYSERWRLLTLTPDARQKRLEEICGASSQFAATRAEAAAIERPRDPLELTCAVTRPVVEFAEDPDSLSLPIDGAWIEAVPDFAAANRTHPVLFFFPRTDTLRLDVTAPRGYAPEEMGPPTRHKGRFGEYFLSIETTPTGYRVERSFRLLPLIVAPADYARLRSFLADVRQADRIALVFKRKVEEGTEP